MTTYSTLLWQGTGQATQLTIYTVPSGFTTVVRDVEVLNGSGASLSFHLSTHAVPGFADSNFAGHVGIPNGDGWQWQGRVVLPSSSQVQMPAFGTSVWVMMSGYQLSP